MQVDYLTAAVHKMRTWMSGKHNMTCRVECKREEDGFGKNHVHTVSWGNSWNSLVFSQLD